MNEQARLPVFDGHNDVSAKLDTGPKEDSGDIFFTRGSEGHLDFPRAVEGGFCGGLFAIFVSPPKTTQEEKSVEPKRPDYRPVDLSYAQEVTRRRIELLKGLERKAGAGVTIARTVKEIAEAMERKKISIVIHLEGAEAIDPRLEALEAFYRQGVRSLGIVWSRQNAFGHGVPYRQPGMPDMGPGLTEAGKALVRACNQRGILVDLSHLNGKGFWDVAGISTAPLVASHSCVHTLCPIPRNLTDRQIDAIGESGGLIGVNFSVMFTRPDRERNPDTPLSVLVDHFTYIADRIGVDHVAMGSDFDGTTIPSELGDVAGLPRLVEALRRGGFREEDLEKIAFRNWLRVLSSTWKEAAPPP